MTTAARDPLAPPAAAAEAAALVVGCEAAETYVEAATAAAAFLTSLVGPVEALASVDRTDPETDGAASGRPGPGPQVTLRSLRPEGPQTDATLLQAVALAALFSPAGYAAHHGVYGVRPLGAAGREVLVGRQAERSTPRAVSDALTTAAAALTIASRRPDAGPPVESLAGFAIDFCDAVLSGVDADDIFDRLADAVADVSGAAAVVVVSCEDRRSEVRSVRGVPRTPDLCDACSAAADEARGAGRAVEWPAASALDRPARQALARTAETLGGDGATLWAVPVRDAASAAVVLLMSGPKAVADLAAWDAALSPTLGLAVRSREDAVRPPWKAAIRRVRRAASGKWSRVAALAACGVAAALCVPRPYVSDGRCVLRPDVRRFVAAPFDGTLSAVHVEPGDVVSVGQPLAELDAREIAWERAGTVAEIAEASKRRDAFQAAGELSDAQKAGFDIERLTARAELLAGRADRLRVTAPLAGLVVEGDLKGAHGMPVETGRTLFQIAPLDTLLCEVLVPEFDYAEVRPGQAVEVALSALPGQTLAGRVRRVRPRAEIRDAETVFVAEVRLSNPDGLLRPGMSGDAEVVTEPHLWGRNLWHRAAGRWGRGW